MNEKQENTKVIVEDVQIKHRPKLWKHLIGQDTVVKMIRSKLDIGKFPHASMMTGPSGCGKTTAARIVKVKLQCHDGDYFEINAASKESRGINAVQEIESRMRLASLYGKARIWVLDECHKMTSDGQQSLIKLLEDMPAHVYFILATTDPGKLIKTIHTRCTEFKFAQLKEKDLTTIMRDVSDKEGWEPSDAVMERITEVSEGSARKALVVLGQVMELQTEEDRLAAVGKSETKHQARELTKLLMDGCRDWKKIAAILKDVEDEPESLRCMILGYANALLLNGAKANRACEIIAALESSWHYQSGIGGRSMLNSRCWELTQPK